jgi:hypothetical protein
MLDTCSPAGGAILGGGANFTRWVLAGGCRSLEACL